MDRNAQNAAMDPARGTHGKRHSWQTSHEADTMVARWRVDPACVTLEGHPMLKTTPARAFSKTLKTFKTASGKEGSFYSLPELARTYPNVKRLPVSIRIVLESVLRNCDGKKVTPDHVAQLANWKPNAERSEEIPFVVARVVLQDFTGVPLLADLAAMRNVAAAMGKRYLPLPPRLLPRPGRRKPRPPSCRWPQTMPKRNPLQTPPAQTAPTMPQSRSLRSRANPSIRAQRQARPHAGNCCVRVSVLRPTAQIAVKITTKASRRWHLPRY